MNRHARLAVILFFAALLLTPFLIRRFTQPSAATLASGKADPVSQYGFRLIDVTRFTSFRVST